MALFDWHDELNRDGNRVVISGQPVAMHCHHYNINLQKTIEETLGDEGVELLYRSMEETNYHTLRSLFLQYKKIRTIKSKLEMAALMFQHCGLGIIHYQKIHPSESIIVSPSSHHVTGWLAKNGKRDTPGCHFTRGWIGGLLTAIYDRPLGYFKVTEIHCKMMRAHECVFVVKEN